MILLNVKIWDINAGVIYWNADKNYSTFEISKDFVHYGLDLAPLTMPLKDIMRGQYIFEFPELSYRTYNGLPGLLSDSLPDSYGNRLILSWLERQGKDEKSFSPVEKLSYIGKRGMGALEYEPAIKPFEESSSKIELNELLDLAEKVLAERKKIKLNLSEDEEKVLSELIKIGTSAGGQRPKAIIAYNKKTGEIRSGQINAPEGFKNCILKFDGIKSGSLGDPEGFGKIEFVYHKMATACGIKMMPCDLISGNNRTHFLTERFDRVGNEKIHLQTLCAVAHYDYLLPGAYSYEGALAEMREMELPYEDIEQLYKRMVFNIIARNQDDHSKNISFILKKGGEWRLAPAYDVCWAFNPSGEWTDKHQMTINSKRDDFIEKDLLDFAAQQGINKPNEIIESVKEAVAYWTKLARQYDINNEAIKYIEKTHRLDL